MIHAANTVTYKMVNDNESWNKEMERESSKCNVMHSPNMKTTDVYRIDAGLE
jgi:hypothetical protein